MTVGKWAIFHILKLIVCSVRNIQPQNVIPQKNAFFAICESSVPWLKIAFPLSMWRSTRDHSFPCSCHNVTQCYSPWAEDCMYCLDPLYQTNAWHLLGEAPNNRFALLATTLSNASFLCTTYGQELTFSENVKTACKTYFYNLCRSAQ